MRPAGFPRHAAAVLLALAAYVYATRVVASLDGLSLITGAVILGVPMLLGILGVLWMEGALPTVIASWRGITTRQIVWTLLAGCAFHAYHTFVTIKGQYAQYIFVGDEMKAFGLLLTIVAVDGLTGKDSDRREVYGLALLLYVATILPLNTIVIASLILTLEDPMAKPVGRFGFFLANYFEVLMIAGAVTWVINDRRKAQRERNRMHAAELSRIEAERQSVESDLQAMQARVEPQFLFNTLAHVKRAYVQDPAQGAQVLDALIAYLRAAMPKMRDTSSTVEQEFDLVRAYLEIVKVRLATRLAFVIAAPDDHLGNARMPAMLMLPLVDHAIANCVGEWHSTGSIHLRVEAADGKIRFLLSRTGTNDLGDDDERVLAIRERLAVLYAGDANLVMRRMEPDQVQSVLEIPHERAVVDRAEAVQRADSPMLVPTGAPAL